MKAKSFINRSFAASDDDDFPLAALWAASSLELLAKSALCKINPLLVANPTDDGTSLLLAAGLPGDIGKYRSVTAKTLFSRCARAFRTFNKKVAMGIAHQRNAELHSGAAPFNAIGDQWVWWERYWSLAEVLINHYAGSLKDFVGLGRLNEVQGHLERNRANVKRRVQSRFDAAKQRLQLGMVPPELPKHYGELEDYIECPVCGDDSLLQGEYGDRIGFITGGTEDEVWIDEQIEAWTNYFGCENCGLVIEGEDYIAAAGLPPTFETERPYEPEEWDMYDYGDYANE